MLVFARFRVWMNRVLCCLHGPVFVLKLTEDYRALYDLLNQFTPNYVAIFALRIN